MTATGTKKKKLAAHTCAWDDCCVQTATVASVSPTCSAPQAFIELLRAHKPHPCAILPTRFIVDQQGHLLTQLVGGVSASRSSPSSQELHDLHPKKRLSEATRQVNACFAMRGHTFGGTDAPLGELAHKRHCHVVVDALEEHLALIVNDLATLGCPEGAHESLKKVGALVVTEQHTEGNAIQREWGPTTKTRPMEQPTSDTNHNPPRTRRERPCAGKLE